MKTPRGGDEAKAAAPAPPIARPRATASGPGGFMSAKPSPRGGTVRSFGATFKVAPAAERGAKPGDGRNGDGRRSWELRSRSMLAAGAAARAGVASPGKGGASLRKLGSFHRFVGGAERAANRAGSIAFGIGASASYGWAAATRSGRSADGEAKERAVWGVADYLLGDPFGQCVLLGVVALCQIAVGTGMWCVTGGVDGYASTGLFQSAWISWTLFFDPGTQTSIPADERVLPKLVAIVLSVSGFAFNLVVMGLIVEYVRKTLRWWRLTRGRVVLNDGPCRGVPSRGVPPPRSLRAATSFASLRRGRLARVAARRGRRRCRGPRRRTASGNMRTRRWRWRTSTRRATSRPRRRRSRRASCPSCPCPASCRRPGSSTRRRSWRRSPAAARSARSARSRRRACSRGRRRRRRASRRCSCRRASRP